jgi:hypothetical protein
LCCCRVFPTFAGIPALAGVHPFAGISAAAGNIFCVAPLLMFMLLFDNMTWHFCPVADVPFVSGVPHAIDRS